MPESSEAIDQSKKPETFLHTVIVDVPTEETGLRMTRLLEVLNKIDATEADKASRVSDFNAEIKQLNKEAHKLREAITTGKERRDVECYEQPDERRNIVFIVRASDGKAIDERAMTLEDRQEPLPFGDNKPKPADGGDETPAASEDQASDDAELQAQSDAAAAAATNKVVRIKPSDAKKRKAAREAKEAADKARKLADENDAANADDSDEDDEA